MSRNSENSIRQTCPDGLTDDDLHAVLGGRYPEFRSWMRGQTAGGCTCEPFSGSLGVHGVVTYQSDVRRFLGGLPVMDW